MFLAEWNLIFVKYKNNYLRIGLKRPEIKMERGYNEATWVLQTNL